MIGCLTETTTCVVAKPLVDIKLLRKCGALKLASQNIDKPLPGIFFSTAVNLSFIKFIATLSGGSFMATFSWGSFMTTQYGGKIVVKLNRI